MPPLLLLIGLVLFGAWLGVSRLFGRKRGRSHSLTGAFMGEAISWLIVFLLGLTGFVGSAFWTAALALHPIALAILGLGIGGIVIASFLIALARDPAPSRSTRRSKRSVTSWASLWRKYRGEKVPEWMRQIDLGDGIELDGRIWRVDDKGRLSPVDQPTKPEHHRDWLHWLID